MVNYYRHDECRELNDIYEQQVILSERKEALMDSMLLSYKSAEKEYLNIIEFNEQINKSLEKDLKRTKRNFRLVKIGGVVALTSVGVLVVVAALK